MINTYTQQSRKGEENGFLLATQEFVSTLGAVLGGQMTSTELTLLFRRMDANLDDEVDWDEFSDFMLLKSMSGASTWTVMSPVRASTLLTNQR